MALISSDSEIKMQREKNAEIVESFINFITANMRQKTDPCPRVLWVQARQIECEYNIFLVKMSRQKGGRRPRSSSSSSYSDLTEVSLLSWMGVTEFCPLHHCLLTAELELIAAGAAGIYQFAPH